MPFSKIFGNDPIKEHLTRISKSGKIGNLLLFSGPEGIGKSLFAKAFAKLILNDHALTTHPDLHIYRPEGKIGMHSLASMRALSNEIHLPPYKAERKVFIVHHADRMLPYSANALLKTFEEPSPESVIILVSDTPELLLPTILSRCGIFRFQSLKEREIANWLIDQKQLSAEQASYIAIHSHGSVNKALRLYEGDIDPIHTAIKQLFSEGKFQSYSLLAAKAKEMAEKVENKVKQIEASSREELLKGYNDKLTASQREEIDKEVEGAMTMLLATEAETIFDHLLTWYRDLHLLKLNGESKFLLNGSALSQLEKYVLDPIPTFEELFDAIKTARLALARSTPLHLCLENIFLKLNL